MYAFSRSAPFPPWLICATDELIDWFFVFFFFYNYQTFCQPPCKNSLGKEGEATGVSYSSRDAALILHSLCHAVKLHVTTTGRCLLLSALQPGWEHLAMGWGKELACKGLFHVKVSRRLYQSTARSKREQSFPLHFFCNLLLLSIAALRV